MKESFRTLLSKYQIVEDWEQNVEGKEFVMFLYALTFFISFQASSNICSRA